MIQNLSFTNHFSGQRKIDLVVFHCHLDEGNMKNTCVGWRNSCEQFENIRMALSSMLGGAARAVQAVQPATCLRCSRLRETQEGSHVSRLCRCIHPLVKNDRGRFTGIKSMARHPFHFPRCTVQCLDPKNLGDALFGNPNRRLLLYRGKETGLSSDQMVGFVQNWNKADALNVNTVRKNPNAIQGLSMTRMHWRKAAEGVLNFASVGLLITYGTISAFDFECRSQSWR